MLTRLKNTSSALVYGTKKYLPATFFSIGQVISASGQSLLTFPDFSKFVTGDENHFLVKPAVAVSFIANFMSELMVYVPSIFGLGKKPEPIPLTAEPLKYLQMACQPKAQTAAGNGLVLLFKMFGLLSGMSLSLYANNATYNIADYLSKNLFGVDLEDTGAAEYAIIAIGLFFFLSRFRSFQRFQLPKVEENATKVANILFGTEKGEYDRYFIATAGIIFFGTMCTPFSAFYSTQKALSHLPFVLPDDMKFWAGILSSSAGVSTTLITRTFAVHEMLSRKKTITYQPHWCEKLFLPIGYTAGILCSMGDSVSNFTGGISTSEKLFKLDIKHLFSFSSMNDYVIVSVASALAISTAATSFSFKTAQGLPRTIIAWHQSRNDDLCEIIVDKNQSTPGEATIIHLESQPLNIQVTPKTPLNHFFAKPSSPKKIASRSNETEVALSLDY